MSPWTGLGLLVVALVVVAILAFAPGRPGNARLCPQPVSVAGRTVSCDGAMPSPDPTPGAAR